MSIDTLRADTLEEVALAHPDRGFGFLRDQFTRCPRTVSTASWTLPAHASMFTGAVPAVHGATRPQTVIRDDLPMLAERLRDTGYETVGFTDGGYVHASLGFARGFQLYDSLADADHEVVRAFLPRGGAPEATPGEAPFDRARRFLSLRRRGADPPLFLFLHSYAVHEYFRGRPWEVPEPGRNLLADRLLRCHRVVERCTARDWEQAFELYTADIRRFGVLLSSFLELAEKRLDDRPLAVVVVSDHGEAFDRDGGFIHHGGWLRPEYLRVPLWLRLPAGSPPLECDRLTSLVDLAPTLGDLAGADGRWIGGRSLLEDRAPSPRVVYAEEHFYLWKEGRRHDTPRLQEPLPRVAAVDDEDWALVDSSQELVLHWGTGAPETPRPVDGFESLLELARSHRDFTRAIEVEEVPLDEDLRKRLEALGYLTDPE